MLCAATYNKSIYTVCSSYIIWFAQIVDFYLFLIAEECNKKLEKASVYCVNFFYTSSYLDVLNLNLGLK